MQVRHEFLHFTVSGDEIVAHVGWVAGCVPDALKAIDWRQGVDQGRKSAITVGPGIHVLTQQYDLTSATIDELMGLPKDIPERARNLGAARVGHHAIGA